jgi:hypothetical protein
MSAEAIAGHAPGLARGLRLEEILLNASAMPLPIDLTPSMIPQSLWDSHERLTDAASLSSDDTPVHVVRVLPDASASGHGPVDEGMVNDAVVNSLQAARDAIRDSLRQDLPGHSGDTDTHDGTSVNLPDSLPPRPAA